MHRLALLTTAALATFATAQSTVVIPNGYANAEGGTSNAFPWGRTGIGLRHQCVYDSSHFTNQAITSPILITGLKWRPNTNVALVASSYTSGCSVFLSTCPVNQSAVTANFAANRGADYAQVFSGPVSWGAQPAQPGPTPFGISIPFTTPFLYDPSLGDLNVECDLPVQTFTGSGPQLDVEAGVATSLASRVYMSTGYPTGTTFVNNNHAVVIEVTYVPASGYALATPFGTGCINVPDVSSYELFPTAAAFDLSNTAISMLKTPTGYTALPGFVTYVPPTAAAQVVANGDDVETTVALALPLPIGASGTTSQLTICSNGFVSSGPGNGTTFTPTAPTFLNGPAVWWSAAWHDLNPTIAGSGQVKFEQAGGFAYVTWEGVWDYSGTSAANANTFQIQFDLATGHVHYVYGAMSTLGATGFLTGVSDAGPSPDPGSMDISAALPATYQAAVFAITPLQHGASARPVIGTSINLLTTNVPSASPVGLTIFGLNEYPTGFDLTFLGMPGCNLYASLDATATFVPAGGIGSTPFAIPSNPALAGQILRSQGAAFVPGINAFGFIVSNGQRLTLDVQ